ncbi:aconitate hydratase AcnA [Arthrobacter sulfonylureivorans]|uniref:Aconitate hydratase n=1 Tax=Arthrobacter sulfonylureivorans TaxID=2486855 RepID=A0ABY3WBJ8_9MICC|nr:aconitate hydratase AcnA [Arthrobacter sulfonylureivorans]
MTSFLDSTMTSTLSVGGREVRYIDVGSIDGADSLPYSLKVLLENVIRHGGGGDSIEALLQRKDPDERQEGAEIPFSPARVVMQDMAGAPVVHDLVTLRETVQRLGGDASLINPLIPGELVIDHSVIVDSFGNPSAFQRNAQLEFERNRERFRFLRWAQSALDNFRVIPPGTGIIHQINIENLTRGVMTAEVDGEVLAYPDTCIGTDSHTTMVNGLGVLGWGVGGIEATAALLGQPLSMLIPPVVGVEIVGELQAGTTATDVVLTVTEMLRKHGVVGKIVEFYGPGLARVPVADRTTIANMSPEFGSTAAMFPIDAATIDYYRLTGRSPEQVELIEAYARAQGLWNDGAGTPARYSDYLRLNLSTVVPSIAGPYRPQDRIELTRAREQFRTDVKDLHAGRSTSGPVQVDLDGTHYDLNHGALAIAAITSCTNTSNPHVMMTAALLAKNAVERGLTVPPWVKTSMAPGSQVVTQYLEKAGLLPSLEKLGFHVVGYGCTTCMGNSGPLPPPMSAAVREKNLTLTSILSGNRNFEGRISPDVRMNYLASPPLVIAYALAGTMDLDIQEDPLGQDNDGHEVHLRDLWPTPEEVERELSRVVTRQMYLDSYSALFTGSGQWQDLQVPSGATYDFGTESTYLRSSPFLQGIGLEPEPIQDLTGARVLVKLGDSITTDHISPVGHIHSDSPAGQYLLDRGVARRDFNTYGSRRGNHEVMVRGTFANVRLRNHLVEGTEGGFTKILPGGEMTTIFDAATRYAEQGTALVVLAGKEYGTGSARDYAAKGTQLLGVRAVLAESYERIHRSNLVGMGVVPLQYFDGQSAEALGLDGTEEISVTGLAEFTGGGWPKTALVEARRADGDVTSFTVTVRVDTPLEATYISHGGILPYVLRSRLSPIPPSSLSAPDRRANAGGVV